MQKQGARAGGRGPEDDLNVKRLSPWPTLEIAFLSVKEGEVNASVCLLPLQLIITMASGGLAGLARGLLSSLCLPFGFGRALTSKLCWVPLSARP